MLKIWNKWFKSIFESIFESWLKNEIKIKENNENKKLIIENEKNIERYKMIVKKVIW